MATTPATTVDTNSAPPSALLSPTSPASSPPPSPPAAANATTLESTSGAPLPRDRNVTPAMAGGRRSAAESPSSDAQKYWDAVSPRR
uniref:K-exchanger-like protein n=1 Tax=Arundo donax TaxID=35708 RepID=A0A0A9A7C3_ARUDO